MIEDLATRLDSLKVRAAQYNPLRRVGHVVQVVGQVVVAQAPVVPTDALCRIQTLDGWVLAEVSGFRPQGLLLLPLGEAKGIATGAAVEVVSDVALVGLSKALRGRTIDPLGRPLDGGPPIDVERLVPLHAAPPPPLSRRRIDTPMTTSVRAIDSLLTLGKGQRIGVFAGSGVGKSTLLGMLARQGEADVNVVGLIGERGREVLEFLERDLGDEGRARTCVVVATSDMPAPLRVRAAYLTTVIAEYFRDMGLDVCLMMDSLTRVAMAQREIGLAIGEPSTTRGYTPSVFAQMPRLLERAGMGAVGSITGIYTVLVEGDDMMEPIADAARGILDGHLVLSRKLAERAHYPAIDVLASVSRVMPAVISDSHQKLAWRARHMLSVLEASRDLVEVGAYAAGSNPALDEALRLESRLLSFLRQSATESAPLAATVAGLATAIGA